MGLGDELRPDSVEEVLLPPPSKHNTGSTQRSTALDSRRLRFGTLGFFLLYFFFNKNRTELRSEWV
jgi:hypothetical protein